MAQVSSYLLTFVGTTPANPKAPEGEIWIDPDAPPAEESAPVEEMPEQEIDSTAVVAN